MDMFNPSRLAALFAAALALGACSSTGPAPLDGAPPKMATTEPEGVVPDYCPKVSLREGTAILRKGEGAALQYVASIVSTSRECRVVDGVLRMKIGVAGRVMPGPAAKAMELGLPIRIAILRGTDVLYSQQGSRGVVIKPGAGAEQFVYVDQSIEIPEPERKDLVIYAGFDEGPQG